MKIKLRSQDKTGMRKIEEKTVIREVMIHEDFLDPKNEMIALGFAQGNTSGLIEFSIGEFEKLYKKVKDKLHLIKSAKMLGNDGAIVFNEK